MLDESQKRKTIAVRTCVATRTVKPVNQLLRCVAQPGDDGMMMVVPDPRRCLSGRGAWISPTVSAVDQAITRRAFIRALRIRTNAVDYSGLKDYVGRSQ